MIAVMILFALIGAVAIAGVTALLVAELNADAARRRDKKIGGPR